MASSRSGTTSLPEARDDFYEWHNREHMPERVGIPGFRRGRRYVAISGTPEFFNLYEADSPETLSGQDYQNRLNAPTPWTQRVVPSFRNVARSICRVAFTNGVGQRRRHAHAALRDRRRAPRRHHRRAAPAHAAAARVPQGRGRRSPVPRGRSRQQRRDRRAQGARQRHGGAVVDRADRGHLACPTSTARPTTSCRRSRRTARNRSSAPCIGSRSRASRHPGRRLDRSCPSSRPSNTTPRTPEVRAVYDDIMATRRVPSVNNFWKVLAHDPDNLARVWSQVKAVMGDGALDPLVKEMLYIAVSRHQQLRVLHSLAHGRRARQGDDARDVPRAPGGRRARQRNEPVRQRLPHRRRRSLQDPLAR